MSARYFIPPWALPHLHIRLRKDPLDPIDSGTKVKILFMRMTDPEIMKREEAAKAVREEAERKAKAEGKPAPAAASKKAGSWGGLGR